MSPLPQVAACWLWIIPPIQRRAVDFHLAKMVSIRCSGAYNFDIKRVSSPRGYKSYRSHRHSIEHGQRPVRVGTKARGRLNVRSTSPSSVGSVMYQSLKSCLNIWSHVFIIVLWVYRLFGQLIVLHVTFLVFDHSLLSAYSLMLHCFLS